MASASSSQRQCRTPTMSASQKALLRKTIERSRQIAGVPTFTLDQAGEKIYSCVPVHITSLLMDAEAKKRVEILKKLTAFEKEKEKGLPNQTIVFCHMTKAFLLANTTHLHIEGVQERIIANGHSYFMVQVRGLKDLFLANGADEAEADRASWYRIPPYLSQIFAEELQQNLNITWNAIRAVDVTTSTKKYSVPIFANNKPKTNNKTAEEVVTEELCGTDPTKSISQQLLEHAEELATETYVYTTISLVLDDFICPVPKDLFPFEPESRIIHHSPAQSSSSSSAPATDGTPTTGGQKRKRGGARQETKTADKKAKTEKTPSPELPSVNSPDTQGVQVCAVCICNASQP